MVRQHESRGDFRDPHTEMHRYTRVRSDMKVITFVHEFDQIAREEFDNRCLKIKSIVLHDEDGGSYAGRFALQLSDLRGVGRMDVSALQKSIKEWVMESGLYPRWCDGATPTFVVRIELFIS